MVTSKQCYALWGDPAANERKFMTMWDVPAELEIGVIPKRIYCNKIMVQPLTVAFQNLISTGYVDELKTWNGCFNIRKKTSGTTASLHSWGIAIDVNAAWNGFNRKPTMSAGFVECFVQAGFLWGGVWKRPDGMHHELSTINEKELQAILAKNQLRG